MVTTTGPSKVYEADPAHCSSYGDAALTKLTAVISHNSLLPIPAHSDITLYL